MATITVTENIQNSNNLYYLQNTLAQLFCREDCSSSRQDVGCRSQLIINFPDCYEEIIFTEIIDVISEIVAINYKYRYFQNSVKVAGLSSLEKEILLTSLIAADLIEDKRYSFERFKGQTEIAIDGVFNFRLQPLKRKWEDIASYMPSCFVNSQLKDFISFLLENKKKRVYIDGGKVYDSHYKRLLRANLMENDKLEVIKEVLLSNCGEIEINGEIPKEDEMYIKEFYKDKIFF